MKNQMLNKYNNGEKPQLVDMSKRKNLTIEYDDFFTLMNEEETNLLLEDMRMRRDQVKNEYYSNNASIERINQRSFLDILRAKFPKKEKL